MKQFDYEAAMLDYEATVLRQREKYQKTPPGISDPGKASQLWKTLAKRREAYASEKIPVLLSKSEIPQEPFAGRESELAQIADAFAAGRGPVVICGIGGIGKTALAHAYARTFARHYTHQLFLTYEGSLERLITNDSLLQIRGMRYSTDIYRSRRRYCHAKMKALRSALEKEKTLLVLDDWNRPEGKLQTEVLGLPCDVLVTTRTAPELWSPGTAFELKALQTDREWLAFYRLFSADAADEAPDADKRLREELENYRRKVQGHTLRMKLCAAALRSGTSRILWTDHILDRFSLKQREVRILMALSVMPVEGIEESRFLRITEAAPASIAQLEKYLLIQAVSSDRNPVERRLSLHPVIAEAVRRRYHPSPENCRALVTGLARELKLIWMKKKSESDSWENLVFSLLACFPEPPVRLAREFEVLYTFLWLQEYYNEAETYMKRLLTRVERQCGSDHPLTGEMQLRLAAVYFNARAMQEADEWYERAYETLRSVKKPDFRQQGQLSLAASKLSRVYRSRRQFDRAMELIDEAISLFYLCIGRLRLAAKDSVQVGSLPFYTYITVSWYYLDKGKIYLRTGRVGEAEAMLGKALGVLKEDERAARLAERALVPPSMRNTAFTS